MATPVMSVVIPTRDRPELLAAAIRSALGQTLSDIEVLVVDDASEGASADVVAGFQDARLRLLRHGVSQGASAARNTGIRASAGEYVAFLDDDDEWYPEKLEKQLRVFRRGGPELGVVYSSYTVQERPTGAILGRKVAWKRGFLREAILERNHVGSTSCAVVLRRAFDRVGLWDERLPSFQDYDLWIRLGREFAFDFVDEDLLTYSVHPNRIWGSLDTLDRGIDLMTEKHGSSRALRRYLAGHSHGVGVQYCSRGEMGKGRAALRRAVRLDPASPRALANLVLAHLGGPVFRGVREARGQMLAWGAGGRASAGPLPKEIGR
jgi:glycosyltransferase involved in cell wall biosynthesis